MEEHYSVSSPRRVLSFSKRRRATVSFPYPDDKAGFGVSGEHGPKTSEVYGFVGAISTIVATVIFFVWAYLPEPWLHSIGIFYYTNMYWALAIPTYAMLSAFLALVFYIGLNFLSTPRASSLCTVFDELSREPANPVPLSEGDDDWPIKDNQILALSLKEKGKRRSCITSGGTPLLLIVAHISKKLSK